MSKYANKISETIIIGQNCKASSIHHRSRLSTEPLKTIGLHSAWSWIVGDYLKLTHTYNNFLYYKLILVLEGESELETNSGTFKIKEGDFVHIPSFTYKRQEVIAGPYMEIGCIFYDYEASECFKTDQLIIRGSTLSREIRSAYEGFIHESASPELMAKRSAYAFAELMAVYLTREAQNDRSFDATWTARFSNLQKLILSDLTKNWTVPILAKKMFVSPSHLHRLTKQFFNKTPQEYLTALRMQHAMQLLSGANYSLDSVANLTGYANAYSFSNAFLRYYGQRPGKFRKELLSHPQQGGKLNG